MDTGAEVLRDIHGLDVISWWPLAPGWWLLMTVLVVALLALLARYLLSCSGTLTGWRGDARRQLRQLQKALKQDKPREVAARLSILLRRIAMASSGRHGIASLSGEQWLEWLENNDNNGFKWSAHGRLLLEAPYMPPGRDVPDQDVARLVTATRRWVDSQKGNLEQCGIIQRRRLALGRRGRG